MSELNDLNKLSELTEPKKRDKRVNADFYTVVSALAQLIERADQDATKNPLVKESENNVNIKNEIKDIGQRI